MNGLSARQCTASISSSRRAVSRAPVDEDTFDALAATGFAAFLAAGFLAGGVGFFATLPFLTAINVPRASPLCDGRSVCSVSGLGEQDPCRQTLGQVGCGD